MKFVAAVDLEKQSNVMTSNKDMNKRFNKKDFKSEEGNEEECGNS